MKKSGMVLFFLTLMAAAPDAVLDAATLDCQGGIVSTGDSRVDLLAKCGEPDAKESHDEEIIEKLDGGSRQRLFITVEDWTYNFGPTQLMRIVTLRNGTVSHIRTGNYGYSRSSKPQQRECSEQIVATGDTKSDVIAKCGEPSWKDRHQEEREETLDTGDRRKVFITVEEWTYNLGPNRFVRVLTFKNNILVDIRTGGYGY
ncbi:MAG TPA: DUF2845 domain-containing protein [Nitrospirota bacterium]